MPLIMTAAAHKTVPQRHRGLPNALITASCQLHTLWPFFVTSTYQSLRHKAYIKKVYCGFSPADIEIWQLWQVMPSVNTVWHINHMTHNPLVMPYHIIETSLTLVQVMAYCLTVTVIFNILITEMCGKIPHSKILWGSAMALWLVNLLITFI